MRAFLVLLICQSGLFPLRGFSLGRAGGCCGLWHFCFPLQLGFCRIHGVLCAPAVPASCPCCAPCVGDHTVPLSPASSAAYLALGWSPDPSGAGAAGANVPFLLLCGSSPVLNCTAPFPALHVPSRPWPGFWVWFVSVWCSGAGSGSGELWGHGPGEAVVGLGNTLGKLPAMIKGIVWTRARER